MSLTKATFSMIQDAVYNVLDYGADPTGVPANVVAICNVAWTADVVAAYQAQVAAQAESIGA